MNKKDLFFELAVFLFCMFSAGLFWEQPFLLTTLYIFLSFLMLKKWHSKKDLFYYFTAFILGPIAEAIAVYFGAWQYSRPFYLIPLWLPFLWGIAALFITKIADTLLSANKI